MSNSQKTYSFFLTYFRNVLVTGIGLLLAVVASPARATFIVTGNIADQATFINLVNADTQGGTWSLNNANQLLFTAGQGVPNNYTIQLNALNNANIARTVNVAQNIPGVLVGAFGPPEDPAGTQLIDLADIQAFTINGAAQPQPLLDTRGSMLLHELAELNADGGAAAFVNSHNNAGIPMQNLIMASQGVLGRRLAVLDVLNIAAPAPGANFATYEARFQFVTTAPVPAGGGQQALGNNAPYREVIRGRITGVNAPFNFDITNIRRGVVNTGYSYDLTGYDVSIESITAEVVEPSTLALLSIGCTFLLWQAAARRHLAA